MMNLLLPRERRDVRTRNFTRLLLLAALFLTSAVTTAGSLLQFVRNAQVAPNTSGQPAFLTFELHQAYYIANPNTDVVVVRNGTSIDVRVQVTPVLNPPGQGFIPTRVALGVFEPGQYQVRAFIADSPDGPGEQFFIGQLGVSGAPAISSVPSTSPFGLLAIAMGVLLLGTRAFRST